MLTCRPGSILQAVARAVQQFSCASEQQDDITGGRQVAFRLESSYCCNMTVTPPEMTAKSSLPSLLKSPTAIEKGFTPMG